MSKGLITQRKPRKDSGANCQFVEIVRRSPDGRARLSFVFAAFFGVLIFYSLLAEQFEGIDGQCAVCGNPRRNQAQ